MNINVTSGECLNEILTKMYPNDTFIPFNEAMIKGSYTSKLFSEEFIKERSACHGAAVEDYKIKLKDFMDLLKDPNKYETIYLWFGDEPFCVENRKVVIESLNLYGFKGTIITNIVNEETGEILYTK